LSPSHTALHFLLPFSPSRFSFYRHHYTIVPFLFIFVIPFSFLCCHCCYCFPSSSMSLLSSFVSLYYLSLSGLFSGLFFSPYSYFPCVFNFYTSYFYSSPQHFLPPFFLSRIICFYCT
jgi:hypothetical protein